MKNKLSLIIPCYNEQASVRTVLEKVYHQALPQEVEKEIIIVDDCSTDGTAQAILDFRDTYKPGNFYLLRHENNKGKGACIRSALDIVSGNIVLIQDADLEYSPADYIKLLAPIIEGHADVVFGSRFIGGEPRRVLFFFHSIGNRLLTFFSNIFTGLNLTDMETGYKMFRTDIIRQIKLKERRFGFEPEVTAKISRVLNVRIYEVGVSYYGRKYADGKKINWTDGFRALYCILKYNIFSRK